MTEPGRPRVVGFNHVALEVGDIEEALAFYGRLFEFELRGKSETMAFIDLGDQFIALQKGRQQPPDDGRHFGLVVDDKETARRALQAAGGLFGDARTLQVQLQAVLFGGPQLHERFDAVVRDELAGREIQRVQSFQFDQRGKSGVGDKGIAKR